MYYMTGLPGWMRLGFSPGWIGRSPTGLGPAAQYLMYGTWPTPQMNYAWQSGQVPYKSMRGFTQFALPGWYDPWVAVKLTAEEELYLLKVEAEQLEDEFSGIERRIKEIEGEKK